MKIIIVGSTGIIGKKVAEELSKRHEVINASRTNAEIKVNIESTSSIEAMYKKVGKFDAVISTTGEGYFGPLKNATDAVFRKGINSKLMGQVNLVLIGQHHINEKGSFTLTTGILADDPVFNGSNLSLVNGGINSFVIAAAIELENNVRINAVSPGVVEDAPHYFPFFPGHIPVAMDNVVAAYIKSVEGFLTGKIIRVF
jgi:NAD(P)-dependent dehydrogenase (short-subunit alcohol dehydrogenase family)